jgi:hypothetical protein
MTLAVATGRAFGAGADPFVACDRHIAAVDASFAFPGPAFGLVLGTARLATQGRRGLAREILLSGREVIAEAAVTAGLATATLGLRRSIRRSPAPPRGRRGSIRPRSPRCIAAPRARGMTPISRRWCAARPGLGQRILGYRAQVAARKKG